MNAALRIRSEATRFLAVGEHVVDVDTLRLLTRPGEPRLTPKAAAVLLQLVRAAGRTLSREDLLNEVWKGTCPTPDVLTQAVTDLRRALGDDLHAPRFVETLPRLGYRLVAPAHVSSTASMRRARLHPRRTQLGAVSRRARAIRGAAWRCARRSALSRSSRSASCAIALHRQQAGTAELKPRWHVSEQRAITADPGPENFPRISPDGTRVAYSVSDVDRAQCAYRAALADAIARDAADGSRLPGEESYPVWSPDGSTIAFARHDGDGCKILLAPALGGSERLHRLRATTGGRIIFRGRRMRGTSSRRCHRRPTPMTWRSRWCRPTAARASALAYQHERRRSGSGRALFA